MSPIWKRTGDSYRMQCVECGGEQFEVSVVVFGERLDCRCISCGNNHMQVGL